MSLSPPHCFKHRHGEKQTEGVNFVLGVALSSTLLYQEASRQTESPRADVQSFFPSHCCDNRHAEKMRVGEGETDDHGVATDDHGVALSSTFPKLFFGVPK